MAREKLESRRSGEAQEGSLENEKADGALKQKESEQKAAGAALLEGEQSDETGTIHEREGETQMSKEEMDAQVLKTLRKNLASAQSKAHTGVEIAEQLLSSSLRELSREEEAMISGSPELRAFSRELQKIEKEYNKLLNELKHTRTSLRGERAIYIDGRLVGEREVYKILSKQENEILKVREKIKAKMNFDPSLRQKVSLAEKSLEEAKHKGREVVAEAEVKLEYYKFEQRGRIDGYTEKVIAKLVANTRVPATTKLRFVKEALDKQGQWRLDEMHSFCRKAEAEMVRFSAY